MGQHDEPAKQPAIELMRNTVKAERREGIWEGNSVTLLGYPFPSAWLHVEEADECFHLSFTRKKGVSRSPAYVVSATA